MPSVGIGLAAESMLGESITFDVQFWNGGSTPGYGPFVDLIFQVSGADGDDGLTFNSATFLGSSLTPVIQTFSAPTGCVQHPYAVDSTNTPLQVCGTPGDQLVTFLLPFGSYVPEQPTATLTINAEMSILADITVPLTVQARGGFQFGNDEFNNPASDPSIVGSFQSKSTTPVILRLRKEYIGPEDETATGPNFPRQYRIVADIAKDQTLSNFILGDALPNNLQYISVTGSSPGGATIPVQPATDAPHNPPGNQLQVQWASVTGSVGTSDALFTFSFFVPLNDANTLAIIPAATGNDALSINDAFASGSWQPIDPRDTAVTVTSNATSNDHTLTDKSIAIQKSVHIAVDNTAPGASPFDVLEYTLEFQISDYFAFNDLIITDTFSDGQLWDNSFSPILRINEHMDNTDGAMNLANYTVTWNHPGDGSTTVEFRISDELVSRGLDNRLLGGCVPPGGTGGPVPNCATFQLQGTRGTLTFRTVIQANFTDTYLPGTPSVDQGDSLSNIVAIDGAVLAVSDLLPTGFREADTSSAGVLIARGSLTKTIYAVRDTVCSPQPCSSVSVSPGDSVTYRFTYNLPTSNIEDLYFIDYLPLPVFSSTEVQTFTAMVSSDPPMAGYAKFGPSDTFYGYTSNTLAPSISSDPAQNSVNFYYGDYANPTNQPSTVDILFTVTVNNKPFADGLFLTNQVLSHEQSTSQQSQTANSIVQIKINEPLLALQKGVIGSTKQNAIIDPLPSGPAGIIFGASGCPQFSGIISSSDLTTNPFNSNISGLDAGDHVTFAVVVENTGAGKDGAFDVRVRDVLPAGLSPVTSTVCVTDGTGAALAYTDLGGGLFGSGIELTDPGSTSTPGGALDPYNDTSGRNLAVITFEAILANTVEPSSTYTNTFFITNYASMEGGLDFTGVDIKEEATVSTSSPVLVKTLESTELNNSANSKTQVVIGELVNYRVALSLPEGTMTQAVIVDTLDNGLAFVGCTAITASAGVSSDLPGGLAAACNPPSTPAYNPTSRQITFTLGNLLNSDINDSVTETIYIDYQAIVTNILANQAGGQRSNNAVFNYGSGSLAARRAPLVTILEPQMDVAKSALIRGAATGDAGDTVTYTVTLRHTSGATNATDAYDVTFSDPLPLTAAGTSAILSPTFSVTDSSSLLTVSDFSLTGSDAAGWVLATPPGTSFDFPFSTTRLVTITISGLLSTDAVWGTTYTNTATVRWSSLDGDVTVSRSIYTPDGVERTGAGGTGSLNDYIDTGSATFQVNNPSAAKVIHGTNLADTTGNNVAVGEQVSYRLTLTIPEGTAYSVTAADVLDAGLGFVQCDAVTVSAAVTSSLGVLDCSRVTINSASNMTMQFGDLVNSDTSQAQTETITVVYTVVVLNNSSAVRGNARNNAVTAYWRLSPGGALRNITASAPNVTVVEPAFQVVKSFTPTTGDINDTVTVTVVITNGSPSNARAYDVNWSDVIPTGLNYVLGSLSQTAGPAVTLSDALAPTLSAIYSDFPLNASATLTFQVTVDPSINPTQVITNTARVTFTSLPGDVTAPQSVYSTVSCERTGNTSGCGTTSNTYSAQGSAQYTPTPPSLTKAVVGSSALHTTNPLQGAIGEVMTYAVVITLPESEIPSLVLVDYLPVGMAFVPGSVAVIPGVFNGSLPTPSVISTGGSGDDVSITFGAITVVGDNIPANNTFTVQLSAYVMDIPANHGIPPTQTTLSNTFSAQIASGPTQVSPPVVITVVEPNLTVTKVFNPAVAGPNDMVTVTLTVSNTGPTDAFDVNLRDPLPFGRFTDVTEISTPVGFVYAYDHGAQQVTYTGGDLLSGTSLQFTFSLKVVDINIGQQVTNTVTISQWTTLPGSDPKERFEPIVTGAGTLNGIRPDLSVSKTNAFSTVVPGQVIPYTITVTNIGTQTAYNVEVTETVPVYTSFDSGASSTGWDCTSLPTCKLLISELAASQVSVVTFAVRLQSSLPDGVNSLTNHVGVGDDGRHGSDPTPENNSDSHTDPITASPAISAVKVYGLSVDPNSNGLVEPGELLTYTITITNSGDRDATNVQFSDVPDSRTSLVVGSVSALPGGTVLSGNTTGDTTVAVSLGTISGGGGTGTVSFQVTIQNPLPAAVVTIPNSGWVTGTNFPRTDTNTVQVTITAQPEYSMIKTDGGLITTPGGTVTYTLTYANNGNQDGTGVFLTETVPLNTTFNAAASLPSVWSCADGSPAGTSCTLVVGGLAVSAGAKTATFAVSVAAAVPAGVIEITNTATIDDDHANGVDPNPANNISSDTTPLTAQPDLTITKTDNLITAAPGQTLTYTLAYGNIGNQGATGVVITETVPANTSFSAGASLPSVWSCPDGSSGGITCTLVIGSVDASQTGTVRFAVIVDYPLPAGIGQITNTARIVDDGTNGEDPTPINNIASDTDNTGGAPDLSVVKTDGITQASAGITLTYTLTVTNTGSRGASGILLTDTIPTYTTYVSSDGGVYNSTTRQVTWPLFNLQAGAPAVTHSVTVQVDASLPGTVKTIANLATVADDGMNGSDPTPENNTHTDIDWIGLADKSLIGSNLADSIPPDVAIGEILTYSVSLVVSPGSIEQVVLVDTLDRGLAHLGCDSITTTAGLSASPNDLASICANAVISTEPPGSSDPVNSGRVLSLNFGTLTNSSSGDITLSVQYRAVVLDSLENTRGATLRNNAQWTWRGGDLRLITPPVTIIEPKLAVAKGAEPTVASPGTVITFSITVSHAVGSNSPAYDVVVTDTLPDNLIYVPGSLKVVSGLPAPTLSASLAPTLTAQWGVFPQGAKVVIEYQATLGRLDEGRSTKNRALLMWSSLPGNLQNPQTPNNSRSTERYYSPGSNVDIYGVQSSVTITAPIQELPKTGFKPGVVTDLPPQPAGEEYVTLASLVLEIPRLNQSLPVVSIPRTSEGWDLTWLYQQAGYLEGTAFPSLQGNSGLTAHVYNADGTPGPFAYLSRMVRGDTVILHAFGWRYEYQVQQVMRVKPYDLSPLKHEEKSWLTLITCQEYNPQSDSYNWRVAVRAILVGVTKE
ncbi:MAG TPA: sortase [Anaerolineaceae bacterium]